MAWFIDDAELQAAEFKAGTVKITATEEYEDPDEKGEPKTYPIMEMPEKNFKNVNPGDCATVTWEFVNEGTKAVQLKVKLTEEWSKSGLEVKNVYLCPIDPVDGKGWVMGQGEEEDNKGEIWLYYVDWSSNELGSVPGTFETEDAKERTVELKVVIVFDAAGIDNDYQRAKYTLGKDSEVYAIQASNEAPDTQWDEWTTVSEEDYEPEEGVAGENYKYFHGPAEPGFSTECWQRANNMEPIDDREKPTVTIKCKKGNTTLSKDTKKYYPGEPVSVTAPDISGYEFKNWDVPRWLDEKYSDGGKTVSFEMPDRDVDLTAKYEVAEKKVTIQYQDDSGKTLYSRKVSKKVGDRFSYEADKVFTKNKRQYVFDKWDVVSGVDEDKVNIDGRKIKFDMPNDNVVITAKYEKMYYLSLQKNKNCWFCSISGGGWYKAGDRVKAEAGCWLHEFKKWEQIAGPTVQDLDSNKKTFTFIMPAADITLKAHFK